MRKYIEKVIQELKEVRPELWAETFVRRKLEFFSLYANGLVSSIEHGTQYFENILAVADGKLEWKEKGEYGDNFRKLTKLCYIRSNEQSDSNADSIQR